MERAFRPWAPTRRLPRAAPKHNTQKEECRLDKGKGVHKKTRIDRWTIVYQPIG